MSHNTTVAISFIGFLVFVGYLCFQFQTGWPILLMFLSSFKTHEEIEKEVKDKKNDKPGDQ